MPKDINDVFKEVQKANQELVKTNKEVHSIEYKLSKDISEIKRILKSLDRKMSIMADKIQQFEIIMDAAELLEEHMEDEEEKYNTEWSPYEDDNEAEDYENYDKDNFDESN
jgi:chromosome segregation ATPase